MAPLQAEGAHFGTREPSPSLSPQALKPRACHSPKASPLTNDTVPALHHTQSDLLPCRLRGAARRAQAAPRQAASPLTSRPPSPAPFVSAPCQLWTELWTRLPCSSAQHPQQIPGVVVR